MFAVAFGAGHWLQLWSRRLSAGGFSAGPSLKVAMSATPGPPQALFKAEQKSLHTCADAISDSLHCDWSSVGSVITVEQLVTATNGAVDAAEAGALIGSNPTATLQDLQNLVQLKHHSQVEKGEDD